MANKKVRGNPDKLQPVRTKQEASERGRNGGIASGKARRKKASLMRCAQRVLESDLTDNIKAGIEKITGELEDENDTIFTAAVAVMAKEAVSGNVQAFRELKDIVRDMDNAYVDDDEDEDELSKALREYAEEL